MQTPSLQTTSAISDHVKKAGELVIDNEQSMSESTDTVKILNTLAKKVDSEEKTYTKPLNDTIKKIREQFKPLKLSIDSALAELKKKQSVYLIQKRKEEQDELNRKKREFEEQALAQAEQMEKVGLSDAANSLVDAAANIQVSNAKVASTGTYATTALRRSVGYELVDITKVDHCLLMVNDKEVKALLSFLKDKFTKEAEEKDLKGDVASDYVYKQLSEGRISGLKIVITETAVTR